jgi:hypothetical protein
MSTKITFITMFCAPLIAVSAFSADWPQYYGPSRNSTSTEKGLLRTWPNDGPKVLWTAPLGIGFGGPAVSAGMVYLLDRDDNVGDTLRVYDLSNGKELWNFAYAGPGKVEFPGSRSTPTVDGDRVYTVGMVGDLYCFSTTTQKPVWHKNIWTDFGGGSGIPASPFAPPAAGGQLPIWGMFRTADLPQSADRRLAGPKRVWSHTTKRPVISNGKQLRSPTGTRKHLRSTAGPRTLVLPWLRSARKIISS